MVEKNKKAAGTLKYGGGLAWLAGAAVGALGWSDIKRLYYPEAYIAQHTTEVTVAPVRTGFWPPLCDFDPVLRAIKHIRHFAFAEHFKINLFGAGRRYPLFSYKNVRYVFYSPIIYLFHRFEFYRR